MSEKIVTIAGESSEVALERSGASFTAGGHSIEIVSTRGDEAEVRVDGRMHVVPFVIQGTTVSFAFDGEIYVADVSEKGARAKARHRDSSTSAPMPGVITKILVREGDVVARGAALLILEAMKMEHQIHAPFDGTVEKINCREGELVQPGLELVEMKQ